MTSNKNHLPGWCHLMRAQRILQDIAPSHTIPEYEPKWNGKYVELEKSIYGNLNLQAWWKRCEDHKASLDTIGEVDETQVIQRPVSSTSSVYSSRTGISSKPDSTYESYTGKLSTRDLNSREISSYNRRRRLYRRSRTPFPRSASDSSSNYSLYSSPSSRYDRSYHHNTSREPTRSFSSYGIAAYDDISSLQLDSSSSSRNNNSPPSTSSGSWTAFGYERVPGVYEFVNPAPKSSPKEKLAKKRAKKVKKTEAQELRAKRRQRIGRKIGEIVLACIWTCA